MIENIPQLATVRISCNGDTGTGLLFFPAPSVDYMYVMTAKHCLAGKNFDKAYSYEDIVLEKIFNPATGVYHSCTLTQTDIIQVSGNVEDLALIIIPKERITALTGIEFNLQVINTDPKISEYLIRGFASFNVQEADRPFILSFLEDQKDNNSLFLLKSEENLDTYFQRALDNVEGLSGAGAFAAVDGNIFLAGIIHSYEDGNVFTATKILAYNRLIDRGKFLPIRPVRPETDPSVIQSFRQIDANREEISSLTVAEWRSYMVSLA